MKTKELIRRLQEADPSGEEEVCVSGNEDIHFVECLPAYYDGRLQVLIRDEKSKYYNIIGAKVRANGSKVKIHTLSIKDALWNDYDMPVDYSDLGPEDAARYKKHHDEIRQQVRNTETELELENFTKWTKRKVQELSAESVDCESIAKTFFDANLSSEDPFPPGLPTVGEGSSYVERRAKQWDMQLKVVQEQNIFRIERVHAAAPTDS